MLAEIESILEGIDKIDSEANGWWETSVGADFGKERLELIRALFARPPHRNLDCCATEGCKATTETH